MLLSLPTQCSKLLSVLKSCAFLSNQHQEHLHSPLNAMFGQRPLKMESSRQPSAPTTWSNLLPHQFQKCKDLCWWQQVTTNSYIWFLKLCLLIDRYLLLTWWIFFLFWFSTQIEKHCTMIYVIVSLQAVIYISILFSCIVYNVLSTE